MWADLGNLRNVLVTHNVIEPLGGFLFYAGATNGTGYTVSNVQFTENVVRTAGALPGDYGIWYRAPVRSQRPSAPATCTRTVGRSPTTAERSLRRGRRC